MGRYTHEQLSFIKIIIKFGKNNNQNSFCTKCSIFENRCFFYQHTIGCISEQANLFL